MSSEVSIDFSLPPLTADTIAVSFSLEPGLRPAATRCVRAGSCTIFTGSCPLRSCRAAAGDLVSATVRAPPGNQPLKVYWTGSRIRLPDADPAAESDRLPHQPAERPDTRRVSYYLDKLVLARKCLAPVLRDIIGKGGDEDDAGFVVDRRDFVDAGDRARPYTDARSRVRLQALASAKLLDEVTEAMSGSMEEMSTKDNTTRENSMREIATKETSTKQKVTIDLSTLGMETRTVTSGPGTVHVQTSIVGRATGDPSSFEDRRPCNDSVEERDACRDERYHVELFDFERDCIKPSPSIERLLSMEYEKVLCSVEFEGVNQVADDFADETEGFVGETSRPCRDRLPRVETNAESVPLSYNNEASLKMFREYHAAVIHQMIRLRDVLGDMSETVNPSRTFYLGRTSRLNCHNPDPPPNERFRAVADSNRAVPPGSTPQNKPTIISYRLLDGHSLEVRTSSEKLMPLDVPSVRRAESLTDSLSEARQKIVDCLGEMIRARKSLLCEAGEDGGELQSVDEARGVCSGERAGDKGESKAGDEGENLNRYEKECSLKEIYEKESSLNEASGEESDLETREKKCTLKETYEENRDWGSEKVAMVDERSEHPGNRGKDIGGEDSTSREADSQSGDSDASRVSSIYKNEMFDRAYETEQKESRPRRKLVERNADRYEERYIGSWCQGRGRDSAVEGRCGKILGDRGAYDRKLAREERARGRSACRDISEKCIREPTTERRVKDENLAREKSERKRITSPNAAGTRAIKENNCARVKSSRLDRSPIAVDPVKRKKMLDSRNRRKSGTKETETSSRPQPTKYGDENGRDGERISRNVVDAAKRATGLPEKTDSRMLSRLSMFRDKVKRFYKKVSNYDSDSRGGVDSAPEKRVAASGGGTREKQGSAEEGRIPEGYWKRDKERREKLRGSCRETSLEKDGRERVGIVKGERSNLGGIRCYVRRTGIDLRSDKALETSWRRADIEAARREDAGAKSGSTRRGNCEGPERRNSFLERVSETSEEESSSPGEASSDGSEAGGEVAKPRDGDFDGGRNVGTSRGRTRVGRDSERREELVAKNELSLLIGEKLKQRDADGKPRHGGISNRGRTLAQKCEHEIYHPRRVVQPCIKSSSNETIRRCSDSDEDDGESDEPEDRKNVAREYRVGDETRKVESEIRKDGDAASKISYFIKENNPMQPSIHKPSDHRGNQMEFAAKVHNSLRLYGRGLGTPGNQGSPSHRSTDNRGKSFAINATRSSTPRRDANDPPQRIVDAIATRLQPRPCAPDRKPNARYAVARSPGPTVDARSRPNAPPTDTPSSYIIISRSEPFDEFRRTATNGPGKRATENYATSSVVPRVVASPECERRPVDERRRETNGYEICKPVGRPSGERCGYERICEDENKRFKLERVRLQHTDIASDFSVTKSIVDAASSRPVASRVEWRDSIESRRDSVDSRRESSCLVGSRRDLVDLIRESRGSVESRSDSVERELRGSVESRRDSVDSRREPRNSDELRREPRDSVVPRRDSFKSGREPRRSAESRRNSVESRRETRASVESRREPRDSFESLRAPRDSIESRRDPTRSLVRPSSLPRRLSSVSSEEDLELGLDRISRRSSNCRQRAFRSDRYPRTRYVKEDEARLRSLSRREEREESSRRERRKSTEDIIGRRASRRDSKRCLFDEGRYDRGGGGGGVQEMSSHAMPRKKSRHGHKSRRRKSHAVGNEVTIMKTVYESDEEGNHVVQHESTKITPTRNAAVDVAEGNLGGADACLDVNFGDSILSALSRRGNPPSDNCRSSETRSGDASGPPDRQRHEVDGETRGRRSQATEITSRYPDPGNKTDLPCHLATMTAERICPPPLSVTATTATQKQTAREEDDWLASRTVDSLTSTSVDTSSEERLVREVDCMNSFMRARWLQDKW